MRRFKISSMDRGIKWTAWGVLIELMRCSDRAVSRVLALSGRKRVVTEHRLALLRSHLLELVATMDLILSQAG
jgi:hypothetical protein